MRYYRLTDGLNRVGKLIPASDDPYKYIKSTKKDWYLSVYQYNDDHKKHADEIIEVEKVDKKTGEVAKYKRAKGVEGITDDVFTNLLIFDVDSKTDLDKARKDAVSICERLDSMGVPYDKQNISFSGGKGFSIVVEHDKDLTPKKHKQLAKAIAGDLSTFDPKNYNASRIFRINHTKHNSTGLFKTPLSFEALKDMPISEIKDLAKSEYEIVPMQKTQLPDKILNLRPTEEEPVKKDVAEENVRLDFSKKPYYLSDLKYALQCGFIPEGSGNEGMMILCSTYRHVGFDKTDAYYMLKSVNEKRSEIYGIPKRSKEEIYNQVINVVYSPGWRGGTYTPKESDLLEQTAAKFNVNEKASIVGVDRIKNRFINFADNINKNIIKTGIKSLDDSILMTTGMMVGLLAAPSAGKTSVATTIVETQSKEGHATLFESMDMHDTLIYQRLLQRVSGINIEQTIRKMIQTDKEYDPEYKMDNDPKIIKAMDDVGKIYENVEFNFARGSTIESIEEDIRINKAKHGDNLKVVVVDYLEKVRGPYNDATALSGFVASRLSDLASTYDVLILLLLQPQKSAGDPGEELLSMRKVKGASVIEQDCRVILTMWRPGFNPQNTSDDQFASIAVVKNNMGANVQLDFSWNGLKGSLNELTEVERKHLENVRQAKIEEKEEEKKTKIKGWDI